MEVLLSIIIPMYNAEMYITKALDSALNGVGDCVEIIVIDDGSKDNSYKICSEYQDERVKLLHQENCGAPVARNKGLAVAKGKYIQFFDADDFYENGAVNKIISEINKAEHDCYIGNFYRFNGQESRLEYENLEWIKSTFDLFMFTPSPNSKVFKKEVLIKNGLIFEKLRLAQDLNFYLKFLGVSQDIKVIDFPFFHYRYVEKSISHVTDDRILDIGKSVKYAIDYYKNHDVLKECYSYAYITGVKHTNYQLEKLIYVDSKETVEELFPELEKIWDEFFSKSKPATFDIEFYKKKLIDAIIQFSYRHLVKKHLRQLERAEKR